MPIGSLHAVISNVQTADLHFPDSARTVFLVRGGCVDGACTTKICSNLSRTTPSVVQQPCRVSPRVVRCGGVKRAPGVIRHSMAAHGRPMLNLPPIHTFLGASGARRDPPARTL